MSSKLEIINNGLQGAGIRPVTAANSADKWQMLSSQYQVTVDAELESGNYQFSTYREALTGSVAGAFGFTTGWLLPNDTLFVRHVYVKGVLAQHDWTWHRNVLYITATESVEVEYLKLNDEGNWTKTFVRALTTYMEAIAYRAIRQNAQLAEAREAQAQSEFLRAGITSSRGRQRRDYQQMGRIKRRRLGGT